MLSHPSNIDWLIEVHIKINTFDENQTIQSLECETPNVRFYFEAILIF